MVRHLKIAMGSHPHAFEPSTDGANDRLTANRFMQVGSQQAKGPKLSVRARF